MVEMKLFFAFNKHPHSLPALHSVGNGRMCGAFVRMRDRGRQREGQKGKRNRNGETHRYRKKGNFPISSWFFQFLLGSKPNG